MRKKSRLFCAALFFMAAIQVSATGYKYLTLQKQGGDESSLLLDGLKLTYSGGVMTAIQNGTTASYQVSTLAKMFFTESATAVNTAEADNTVVSLQGASLIVNAPVGTVARVYDALGKLIMSTKITSNGAPSSLGRLQPGIYNVVAGEQTIKILVK